MTKISGVRTVLSAALLLGCWVEVTNKNAACAELLELADDDEDRIVASDDAPRPEQYDEKLALPFGQTRLAQEAAILYYVQRVRCVRVDHDSVGTKVYAANLNDGRLSDDVRDEIALVVAAHRGLGVGASIAPMAAAPPGVRPRLSMEDALAAMFHIPSVPNTQKLLRRLFPLHEMRCVLRLRHSTHSATLHAYVQGTMDSAMHDRLSNLLPEVLTPGFKMVAVEHVETMPLLRSYQTEDERVHVV